MEKQIQLLRNVLDISVFLSNWLFYFTEFNIANGMCLQEQLSGSIVVGVVIVSSKESHNYERFYRNKMGRRTALAILVSKTRRRSLPLCGNTH
jgi:hypothetical protein